MKRILIIQNVLGIRFLDFVSTNAGHSYKYMITDGYQ